MVKEEPNLMLKVLSLRGTDFLLTDTLDLTLKITRNVKGYEIYFVS